jgi:class 3 adenylate cyclase
MADGDREPRLPADVVLLEAQVEQINRFPDQNPNPVMRMSEDGVLLYANPASAPIVAALGAAVGRPLPSDFVEGLRRAAADATVPQVQIVSDHRTYSMVCVAVSEFGFLNLYGTDVTGEKVVARFPDQNPNPVFRLTPDGILRYANDASAPVVKAIGVAVGDALPDDLFAGILELCSGPPHPPLEVRTEDAHTFVLTAVWIPEFDFINVYGTDITGEKVVARFPDQNPNPVFRVTPDGRLGYANAASGPIIRGLGVGLGDALPDDLRERIFRVAEGASDGALEVAGDGRRFVLTPVWVHEFGFINVYGTDVTAVRELEIAHRENERLLLNILPEPIAKRLREGERVIADRFDDVTLLFADIVGFTELSSGLSATEVVDVLNRVFTMVDELVGRYGLEKIKTIGDAYMVVGGLPELMEDHTARVADMALELREEMARMSAAAGQGVHCRIGISVGPVVAGVIGVTKFIYDVWGDTVNTASRMESHGRPDRIHVTEAVYERLRDRYAFEARGTVEIKGKGPMRTYFLLGRGDAVGHRTGRRVRPAAAGSRPGTPTAG